MKISTARVELVGIKSCFDWLETMGLWDSPKKWEKLFKVKWESLKTAEEKQSEASPICLETEELKAIYKESDERGKLYFLLSLNCGFTAEDISSLQKSNIKEENGNLTIERFRGKTGVFSIYPLWDETTILVKKFLNADQNEKRCFICPENGKELVTFHGPNNAYRYDSIGKVWYNMNARIYKRNKDWRFLSFKYMRKTGATMIAAIGGELVAQQYLSHTSKTIAAKHYLKPDYTQLKEALRKLRQELEEIFK